MEPPPGVGCPDRPMRAFVAMPRSSDDRPRARSLQLAAGRDVVQSRGDGCARTGLWSMPCRGSATSLRALDSREHRPHDEPARAGIRRDRPRGYGAPPDASPTDRRHIPMRASYYHGDRTFETGTAAMPTPGPDEALLRVRRVGICGT